MEISRKLVSLRKKEGLTQLQVAEKIDVSRQAISKWESGSAVPSIENLKYLSELYGVSIDYLLCENNKSLDQHEIIAETPYVQQEIRKLKKWLLIFICIIIFVAVGMFIYGKINAEKAQKFSFSGMGSESWDVTEADGFSVSW